MIEEWIVVILMLIGLTMVIYWVCNFSVMFIKFLMKASKKVSKDKKSKIPRMKKIRLFSTKEIKGIDGEEAELYVNFYLVLNSDYIFTFLIDAPNLACSNRNPIRLWKRFLIMLEEETVKHMRIYEKKNIKKEDKDDSTRKTAER